MFGYYVSAPTSCLDTETILRFDQAAKPVSSVKVRLPDTGNRH